MNERIKELAKQAGFHFCDAWTGESKDLEKFAELIVEECARSIDSEIDRLMEYHKELNGKELDESEEYKRRDVDLCVEKCYDIIEMLKSDFGIEE